MFMGGFQSLMFIMKGEGTCSKGVRRSITFKNWNKKTKEMKKNKKDK